MPTKRIKRLYQVMTLEQKAGMGSLVDMAMMLRDEESDLAQLKDKVAAEPIPQTEEERQTQQFRKLVKGAMPPEMLRVFHIGGKPLRFAHLQLTEEEYRSLGSPGLGDEVVLEAAFDRKRKRP